MGSYAMIRYSTESMYSFELVVALVVAFIAICLWWSGDTRPLGIFVIAGIYNSLIELMAQGSGLRRIEVGHLFGSVPVGYPVLPLIMGFFEGGVLVFAGYELARGFLERDRTSLRLGLAVTIGLLALIAAGAMVMRHQIAADPESLRLVRRVLFTRGSLGLLAGCYAISIVSVLLSPDRAARSRALLAWYLAIMTVAALWYTPAFLSGSRTIGRITADGAVPISLPGQAAILYGYNILCEAAGFYLPVYVLGRLARLV